MGKGVAIMEKPDFSPAWAFFLGVRSWVHYQVMNYLKYLSFNCSDISKIEARLTALQ